MQQEVSHAYCHLFKFKSLFAFYVVQYYSIYKNENDDVHIRITKIYLNKYR